MPGGASKGVARPGSAGYTYRHGWVPVTGSGAPDRRSKAEQKRNPSAPPAGITVTTKDGHTTTTGPDPADSLPEMDVKVGDKFNPTHTGLYHATPGHNVEAIRNGGFKRPTGSGDNGAFFGTGTYFHTKKHDATESIEGYRAFIDPSMQHVTADAQVNNPFVVHATSHDMHPGEVMSRELERQGITHPGERLTPGQITARLQQMGYDGVEVKQDGFNHEIGGSQLIVFDAPNQTRVTG